MGIALEASNKTGERRSRRERRCSGMTQHTQIEVGVAAGDSGDAGVVLESRGLKKTYGSGAKSISVLAEANLFLREGGDGCRRPPLGRGKTNLLALAPPAGHPS